MSSEYQWLDQLLAELPVKPLSGDYRAVAKKMLSHINSDVPPSGAGQSSERLDFLIEVGRRDLSLARLIEGHMDATQILREAQRPINEYSLYAIWAAGGPTDTLQIVQNGVDRWSSKLMGCKPFCSGSDIVDRALIYLYPNEQLVEVAIGSEDAAKFCRFDSTGWQSPAFYETHTWSVIFDGLALEKADFIGGPRWYFDRPGFCCGAFAPAACWTGGAMALVDSMRHRTLKDGHSKAHLGAMVAMLCNMRSMLNWAAGQVDADPFNCSGQLFPAALVVRHQIERGCTEIIDRFGRTLGPRPYAFENDNARRIAELQLYIRQCHAERDLEELGVCLAARPELFENYK